MPEDVEAGKVVGSTIYGAQVITIRGNYDDVNRLCSEIADKYGWAFVNINLRPYYTEGAKTYGFEIAEQLGWQLPEHIVVPTAGGTILPKVAKAFKELQGSRADQERRVQDSFRAGRRLRAGDPRAAQGHRPDHAGEARHDRQVDRDRQSRRRLLRAARRCANPADGATSATDPEIIDAIKLLARTEGIFAEPAGGTTLAVAIKLVEQGRIKPDETIVVCDHRQRLQDARGGRRLRSSSRRSSTRGSSDFDALFERLEAANAPRQRRLTR